MDKFNDKLVSAYVTPGNVRLLLLHENIPDDKIRQFFTQAHEYYIKVSSLHFFLWCASPPTRAVFVDVIDVCLAVS